MNTVVNTELRPIREAYFVLVAVPVDKTTDAGEIRMELSALLEERYSGAAHAIFLPHTLVDLLLANSDPPRQAEENRTETRDALIAAVKRLVRRLTWLA